MPRTLLWLQLAQLLQRFHLHDCRDYASPSARDASMLGSIEWHSAKRRLPEPNRQREQHLHPRLHDAHSGVLYRSRGHIIQSL